MGFISNQWLKGKVLRERGYYPVEVSITCSEADDEWSRGNKVVIRFTASQTNGDYQTLLLSRAEADEVAAVIVSCMSKRGRRKLVPSLLRDLSDADLLDALATGLRDRTAAR